MESIEILIVGSCFCLSTFLFYKAAGTLKPNRINVISYVYYIFMLQTFIGTALIVFGFDKHYTLNYLLAREQSIKTTFYVVMIASIALPLAILVVEKVINLNIKKRFSYFLDGCVQCKNEKVAFKVLLFCSIVTLLLLFGFLIKIGYIPALKLIYAPSDFDFSMERGRISNLYFINPYISNLIILSGIPLLSYVIFSYALVIKKKTWWILAMIMFGASVIVKTYKFEKSPVLFHLVVFFMIILFYYGRKIKLFHISFVAVLGALIIILMYISTGYSGAFLDIYNGPIGRTIFTEVGTLSYNFDMFPNIFPFLEGRSLSPSILTLLGQDQGTHLRSAKLLMAYYGSEKVYDGGAGVMNSFFAGEAYANYGFCGVAFSIVWVAIYITLIMWIVLKLRKTPETMAYLAVITMRVGSMIEGGFVDFIYSFDIIFLTIFVLGLYWILESEGKLQKRVLLYVKKIKK